MCIFLHKTKSTKHGTERGQEKRSLSTEAFYCEIGAYIHTHRHRKIEKEKRKGKIPEWLRRTCVYAKSSCSLTDNRIDGILTHLLFSLAISAASTISGVAFSRCWYKTTVWLNSGTHCGFASHFLQWAARCPSIAVFLILLLCSCIFVRNQLTSAIFLKDWKKACANFILFGLKKWKQLWIVAGYNFR